MILRALAIGVVIALCVTLVQADQSPPPPPTDVLVGGEIQPFDDFSVQPIPSDFSGIFRVETGGADQIVAIAAVSAGRWLVVRWIVEPGEAPWQRDYIAEVIGEGLSAPGMAIRALPDGLMMLETGDPENVPTDLWFFYRREK